MSSETPTTSSFSGGNPTSTGITTTKNTSNNNNNNSNHHHKGKSDSFTAYHFASFAAMEVTVTMIPRFTMPRVNTAFGGRYGPFTPNYPVEVPLWLALHIRQTDTCTITPPPFLVVPYLRDVLEREKANDATFEALPFYFFEVVKQLCENSAAAEDVPQVSEVVRLVAEVKATRRRKLQRSMAVFEAEGSPVFIPGIKLTNIVHHELEYLRASFAVVLRQAAEMHRRREHRVGAPLEQQYTPARSSNSNNSGSAVHIHTRMGMGISTDGSGSGMETPSITTTTQHSGEEMLTTTTATTMERGRRTTTTTMTTSMSMTEQQYQQQQQQQSEVESTLFSQTPTGATGTSVSSVTDATDTLTNVTVDALSPPVKKRRTLRQT